MEQELIVYIPEKHKRKGVGFQPLLGEKVLEDSLGCRTEESDIICRKVPRDKSA